jgi:putative protease
LLAPAGDWDCVRAAVENGADAVYFGLARFNARLRAQNFTEADLPALMAFLHGRGVRGYVTFNTLVFEPELAEAEQFLRTLIAAGVDAAIVQDVGLCRLIRRLSPDFPIHASTQMTITSAAGVAFAAELGCQLVVLARECSLPEIARIQAALVHQPQPMPLEVFVHGALCVAYSGQCLTSESLGGRSANRGECAQACRLPYDLISDGQPVPLGDRRYLLSPQDLSGLELVADLARAGVASLKIEGRLKSPEYVANVTRVYRQALDQLGAPGPTGVELTEMSPSAPSSLPLLHARGGEGRGAQDLGSAAASRYELEMAFSRGLHSGWLHGVNHQELVHARFGKKRGVWLGEVSRVESEQVALRLLAPLKPGDGVVFDAGRPDEDEEGGRVYQVEARGAETWLRFGQGDVDFHRIHPGHKVWKTSDPALERRLRQSFAGPQPRFLRPVSAEVHGSVGQPLTLLLRDELGHLVCLNSTLPLAQAQTQPLTPERLREQLGRLGGTPFQLRLLTSHLADNVMLPVSELNRLRREAVAELTAQRAQPPRWTLNGNLSRDDSVRTAPILGRSSPGPAEGSGPIPRRWQEDVAAAGTARTPAAPVAPHLIVLVRSLPQLEAALRGGVRTIYTEFEDPKKYREAVRLVREAAPCADADPQRASGSGPLEIWVAPPRIFKPGEEWILKQVRACDADGYLVRNHEQLSFFAGERRLGDYSLNVANHLAAECFLQRFGLERVTVSYDLNFQQLAALLLAGGADRLEVTLQQHMPMFHMEHCVFCAFLSTGTDYTNCGRPCDRHDVRLRDRVGALHPLRADAGCRNTVFNSQAQTGAEYVERMIALGLRHFRLEFLDETPEQVALTIARYRQLLRGEVSGAQLWKQLRLQNQLGVTRGQMAQEDRRAAAAAQQLARQW